MFAYHVFPGLPLEGVCFRTPYHLQERFQPLLGPFAWIGHSARHTRQDKPRRGGRGCPPHATQCHPEESARVRAITAQLPTVRSPQQAVTIAPS